MNIFYLGLGSNIGNRELYLDHARQLIRKYFSIVACSSIYETEPLHFREQKDFLNQVIKAQTTININSIFQIIQNIENTLGRKKTFHYGPRKIDIDLLLYKNVCFVSKELIIPHPALIKRRFVLEPLYEIDRNLTIPPDNKKLSFYLEKVKEQKINKLAPNNKEKKFNKKILK